MINKKAIAKALKKKTYRKMKKKCFCCKTNTSHDGSFCPNCREYISSLIINKLKPIKDIMEDVKK